MKKRKKEESNQGMELLNLSMDSCIHDFGRIFVQEFLGYDC